jgi:hypothetical protein
VRILAKKHPSGRITTLAPNQTRNDTQAAGDPKVPFPRSIMAVGGGETPFVSKPSIVPLKQDTEQ